TPPRRDVISSVSPSARYASAVSGDRLSKYSTATLFGATSGVRPGSAPAARHGGGEPSGHWAWRPLYDATTLSCTTRVSARSAPGPPSTALDRPRPPVISAATPPRGAGSGGRIGSGRTRVPSAPTKPTRRAARAPGNRRPGRARPPPLGPPREKPRLDWDVPGAASPGATCPPA